MLSVYLTIPLVRSVHFEFPNIPLVAKDNSHSLPKKFPFLPKQFAMKLARLRAGGEGVR